MILAIFIAIIAAFIIPKKILINQIFAGLIQEYRLNTMGIAIKRLRDFYEYDCNRSTDCKVIIDKYCNICNKEFKKNSPESWGNTLHFQRRIVSQFFQHIGNLHYKHNFIIRISMNKFKEYFSQNNLDIIQILYILENNPCETIYTEPIQNFQIDIPNKKRHESLSNMYKLYKASLDW
jgi:hypothetical protein